MKPDSILRDLETPAIVVEASRLAANIQRVADIGRRHRVAVKPHIKTHKSVAIAHQQIAAGACGITASKAAEAEIFIEAGIASVTVAYPLIDERKARRLLTRARELGCVLELVADSTSVLDCLEAAADAAVAPVGVFLKVDVGLNRIGYKADDPALIGAARRLEESNKLVFLGLLSHAGHAYGANNAETVRQIAESERRQVLSARDILDQAGIEVRKISVGSTPTVLAADLFDGITEVRPGNYVYLDLTAVRLGVATLDEVAFTVLTTVVSVNDRYAIVDAGSKVLSSDLGPHGTANVKGYGLAFPLGQTVRESALSEGFTVTKLSEEHGFIELDGRHLTVGDRLRIVPNHSCPVANLAQNMAVLSADGSVEWLQIEAAGKVL